MLTWHLLVTGLVTVLTVARSLASTHEHVAAALKHDYSRNSLRLSDQARSDLDGFFHSPPQWQAKTFEQDRSHIEYVTLNKTLLPLTFQPLPLGTIKPQGWFRQQLELMADGLPGHLHEFYRLVSNATWGGGHEEYSILNEAWPYYINGLVPLAFAVDDQRLLDEIQQQITYVLLSQHSDGWLGPEADVLTRNFWGRYPFFLAAAQYVEAADPTQSIDMLRAMHRFVELMYKMLKDDYQGYVWKQGDRFDEQWGRARASDIVLALQWLYENHPGSNQAKIHECMFLVYEKAFDWSWWFKDDVFLKEDIETYPPELIDPLFPFLHGVNAGQGLKSPAVMGRLIHDTSLLDSSRRGVDLMFKYHGTSSGAIVGDERISGNSPARGTELCSVVETMFSLTTLYQIMGDSSFADRLENAAFNAMPAMIMPKWWAHQYVAQINQPYSYEVPETHFWNVGPWGLTFGTEPNYPCCTVNFPQGYPKLLSSSWVRTPKNNGLAHVVLLPSEIETTIQMGETESYIHIRCETNYPFTQLLTYHVEAQDKLNFSFRVPGWVNLNNPETGIYLNKKADVLVRFDGAQRPLTSPASEDPQPLKPDAHSGLHTVSLPAGSTSFSVYLAPFANSTNPKPIVQERPNSAVALTHGALLFAYTLHGVYTPRRPINYQRPGEAPPEANDWTVVPREKDSISWNIAIDPNTARVHEHKNLYTNPDCGIGIAMNKLSHEHESCDHDWPNPIWAEFQPPVSISVLACEIEWNMSAPVQYEDYKDRDKGKRAVRGGYPLPPPLPDAKTGRQKCIGPAFPIELWPYGSAKIRMTEFPVVNLSRRSGD